MNLHIFCIISSGALRGEAEGAIARDQAAFIKV